MSSISIKQLLEAGVHFGHQTSRWNPKMKQYIFGERNGIHIIDLQQTLKLFKDAVDFVTELAGNGREVLWVGTKPQAQDAVEEDAKRCGMPYVTSRWLGGLLTNFTTVQNSIKRYKQLESMRESGLYEKRSKKEVSKLERERKKLEKSLFGIREMIRLPDAVFVVDSDKETIAVREASRLGIPVIAVVDTNCDPDLVDYVIPGNDDALRSVKLFTATIAEAALAGKSMWEARVSEEQKAKERAEKEEAAARAAAREKARKAGEARKAEEAAAAMAATVAVKKAPKAPAPKAPAPEAPVPATVEVEQPVPVAEAEAVAVTETPAAEEAVAAAEPAPPMAPVEEVPASAGVKAEASSPPKPRKSARVTKKTTEAAASVESKAVTKKPRKAAAKKKASESVSTDEKGTAKASPRKKSAKKTAESKA